MRPAVVVLALITASSPVVAEPASPPAFEAGGPTIGHAPTPPMGWNSWNAFGVGLSETKVLGSAQAIRDSGLAALGYRYINIDDGWWLKRRQPDGRMQVRTNLFPSAAVGGADETSLRPFTDRLHAMGFKAGIYTDIGANACSQAYTSTNPNLPEGSQAEREVGLYGHADQDLTLYFRDWNFDYVKVDGCGLSAFGPAQPQVASGYYRELPPLIVDTDINRTDIQAVKSLYGAVRDALRRLRPGGDFVLALCNWGSANVRSWGPDYGTIWRTSNDIAPTWGHMLHNFDSVSTRALYAGPGHWNDPDMLEVGNGEFDAGHLTEARAHMSIWAIEAAPLIIGADLTRASPDIVQVLGAPEVLAVDQDAAGNQGVLAYADDNRDVVVKTLSQPGTKAVALINRSAGPTDVTLTAGHLKMAADRPIALRDLWTRADLPPFTGEQVFHLAPHETRLLKAAGAPSLPSGYYLSEEPGLLRVTADGIRSLEPDPIIFRPLDPYHRGTTSDGAHPVYAGWGGPRADSSPYDQPIRLGGVTYRDGLGALAGSRLAVTLDGRRRRFDALVGVDDSTRGLTAPVAFEVWGDGRRLAASGPLRFGQPGTEIDADVTGVKALELRTIQLAPDVGPVVIAWAEARVR